MVTEVILPKLGQTMEEGAIVEWLKQEGDEIQRGEVIFTVESDKATLEVEAPTRGFLRKILLPPGQTVPVLTVVGLMTKAADEDISGYGAAAETAEPKAAETAPAEAEVGDKLAPEQPSSGRQFVSPRARRLGREKGIDLAHLAGSGPGGRIVERDVRAYLEQAPRITPVARRLAEGAGLDVRAVAGSGPAGKVTKEDVEQALAARQAPSMPPAPAAVMPTAAKLQPAEARTAQVLSGVRAVIARRMAESHQTTAPVTLTSEVDATQFVEVRERLKAGLADSLGFNIGYNDLLVKAAARALVDFPYMNARLAGDTLEELRDIHVALAVDTDRGLLVPVIRNAERKGLADIAREIRDVVARAREGKALPDELTGSTFTITNLGMHDINAFTPIINLPEAAILGVGRIKAQPVVVDGQVVVRQMMWLSLTFDHRLVDGAPAARFLQRIKQLVEEPFLLLS